jgi:hypothetical protein
MRALRSLSILLLGTWAGVMASAAFAKRAMPSGGDEESDELSLVAIFDGIDLKSRATALQGGSLLAWFGGIDLDLREAELASGARLSVRALFGGIAIKTPPSWRVESKVKAVSGGVDVRTPSSDDPDAPVLVLDGMAVLGGIAVGGKAGAAAASSGR